MIKKFSIILFLIIAFTFSFKANILLTIPGNDSCKGAISMVVTNTCTLTNGSLLGATQSFLPNQCDGGASATANDVWFSFVATANAIDITVTPANISGNNFNVVIELFAGCGTATVAPTPITCADASGNLQTETINATNLIVGNTYYIRVYQYKNNTASADPADPSFTICTTATITAGISKYSTTPDFVIYPNPTANTIYFTSIAKTNTYYITDVNGKTVIEQKDVESHRIDITVLPKGIYFLTIGNALNTQTKKFIKN